MVHPSAQTAINILTRLQAKSQPAMLAYWVTPNSILTLGGARAYCDGVFYSEPRSKKVLQNWTEEIAGSIKVIKSITSIYCATASVAKTVTEEDYASYDVVTSQGLEHVLEQTRLLGPTKRDLLSRSVSAEKLLEKMRVLLKGKKALENFSDENLNHIASGILLGYPDQAILGSVTEWEKDDPFAEPLIDADIRGSGYYICPKPVYSYPRHLVNDPGIKTHEKLWSSILYDFYKSDFHTTLAANAKFQQKADQLGIVR